MEMKRRSVLVLISANLLVLITLAFIYPHLMVSPGALVSGHADLATDCFACHSPWRGATAERCITCHALIDIGARTTEGVPVAQQTVKTAFHQELIEQNCMACHTDHAGPLLSQRDRKPFLHALLRAVVRDRCESCHNGPDDGLHRQITGNCQQCHSPERWTPATFEHAELFVLDRDHNATCETCHTNDNFGRYTCYGCHEHTLANVRAEHLEEGIRDFKDCVQCHRNASEEPEGRRSGNDRE
jgi:hypothetical protein